MTAAAGEHRLLLVRHALGYDGGTTRFLALAEALRRRGGRATIVAGRGPLEGRAADAGDLEIVDAADLTGRARLAVLERAAERHSATLIGCLPMNLPLVPALARRAPVHLCLHSTPAALAASFGGDHAITALGSVLTALHRSGRVLLTAASTLEAGEHRRTLGLADGVLSACPNGVEVPPRKALPRAGPIRSVALVSRFGELKRPHVAAAADLVAAGRAAGREVVLDVHGAGPDRDSAHALVAERLPRRAWAAHGPTMRPLEVMRHADVVVGGGRTCLEAMSVGRRVIVTQAVGSEPPSRAAAAGSLGTPVRPADLDLHVADNFRWSGRAPVAPGEAWRALESIPEHEVARLRDRVHAELSDDVMLDRELALLDELRRRPNAPEHLEVAAAEHSARLA